MVKNIRRSLQPTYIIGSPSVYPYIVQRFMQKYQTVRFEVHTIIS